MTKFKITIPVTYILASSFECVSDVEIAIERLLQTSPEDFSLDGLDWHVEQDITVTKVRSDLPEGVTVVSLDDPEELHNTIADAVGEPREPDRVNLAVSSYQLLTHDEKRNFLGALNLRAD